MSGEKLDVKLALFVLPGGREPKAQPTDGRSKGAGMTAILEHEIEVDELTRTEKLRIAARVLIKRGVAGNGRRWGLQSRLAEHFGVTRQRVSQIVRQELQSIDANSR